MISRLIQVGALTLFAAATIWINYEIKVHVQGGRGGGSVQEMGNVKVGQLAPDFSTKDLSNQMISLSSYRGQKVLLLDFWATWCGPCRMEMVDLQPLVSKFKDQDFEILSLNQGESAVQVSQFITQRKYSFHVLLDADGSASAKYGVRAIPCLVLVDRQGIIQWLQVGYDPADKELEQKIKRLIGK